MVIVVVELFRDLTCIKLINNTKTVLPIIAFIAMQYNKIKFYLLFGYN